jgi:hypothetical protein
MRDLLLPKTSERAILAHNSPESGECRLNALYRQGGGGLRTLFLLSEYAQIGAMESVAACLAQGRGSGWFSARCCKT